MPVNTAAACTPTIACPDVPFPSATASCACDKSFGGVNDLYLIPCSQVMSETNILDVAWWQTLVDGASPGTSFLGNIGSIVGSIGKKATKTQRLSSCNVESLISATWALKAQIFCFDKSVDRVTNAQVNALINNAGKYQLIARMCDGEDTVIPIGTFIVSDFDWVVPDNNQDLQNIVIELSWFELGLPKPYIVTGLSAVVPKAKAA